MTPVEHAERSTRILASFENGEDTADVIITLALTLQMAVCYGAKTKEDALHMIKCLLRDAESDLPERFDMVNEKLGGVHGRRHRRLDIVESLRRAAAQPGCLNALAQEEAADEIERLRKRETDNDTTMPDDA